ncbi:MAG: sensor histidine kinase [Planctomycetota bacterium]|jgi:signal transduction histidine kinase
MRIGIRIKWIGALSLLVLLTGGAFLLTIYMEMTRSLRGALISKGHAVAHSLMHQATDAVLTRNRFLLQTVLNDAQRESTDIQYIIVDVNGKILAHTFDEGIPVQLAEWIADGGRQARFDSDRGSILNIATPIELEPGGTLHMGLSERPINDEVNGVLVRVGGIFGVIYILGLAAVVLVGSFITRPVRNLALRAEKIVSGGVVPRETAAGHDEVATLARTIDDMRVRVSRTERMAEVGMLSAWVAHEINNPLDGVRESIRIVQADASQSEELLPLVNEALGRMEYVVKMLLAHTHKPHLQIRPFAARSVMDGARRDALPLAEKKSVRIETVVPGDAPELHADERAVRQILVNLLFNALDAVDEEGRVKVEFSSENEHVSFRITDDGSGMTPDQLQLVKEPFFTSKPVGQGTGLGLTVCLNLVEAHGGNLEISSTPGKGTTVSVILPAI